MSTTSPLLTPEQLQALLDGPAEKPPAGVLPDFENPPNLDTYLVVTVALTLTFGTLAVFLRLYTKLLISRSFAYEDYAVALGWALQIAETIPSVITTKHGAGFHMWDVRLRTFFEMLYWDNVAWILYCPAVFFIKLSILLQYKRIFVPNQNGHRPMFVSIHILIWSCLIVYTTATFTSLFQCHPRKRLWDPLRTSGSCIDINPGFLFFAIFNVITDFAILVLPMPSIWKLQMPKKRKIMMTAVFGTGSLACLTSILRVHYAGYIASEHDKSYNIARMGFWTFAEIAIGTVVSCSPVLPKFFQHFGPKVHEALSSRSRISDSPKTSDLRHPRSRSLLLRNGLGPKIIPRPDVSIESGTTLSYAERDTSRSWTAMEEENPTLRDHDGTLPIWGIEKYQGTRATSNTATLRDDLEAGLDGIPHGN